MQTKRKKKVKYSRKLLSIKKTVYFFFLIFATPFGLAEAAGPWTGHVVDFETGEPLEGVVVLAVWEKEVNALVDTSEVFWRAYETVTDDNGYFKIPSYINFTLPLIAHGRGPYISFYKPGYLLDKAMGEDSLFGPNIQRPFWEVSPIGTSYKIRIGPHYIALPKLKTTEDRRGNIPFFSIPPQYMPKMIQARKEERKRLRME